MTTAVGYTTFVPIFISCPICHELHATKEEVQACWWNGDLPILPDNMDPCGKKWYRSKEEAAKEMESMSPTRGPDWKLNAYYCDGCDGWHVGHTLSKRNAKIRRRMLAAKAATA